MVQENRVAGRRWRRAAASGITRELEHAIETIRCAFETSRLKWRSLNSIERKPSI